MRDVQLAAFLAGAALVSGCAFHEHSVVLDAVGPSSRQPVAESSVGTLVVFSAFDPNADFNDLPYLRRYTDYKLLSEDGKVLQVVHNNSSSAMGGPELVELPVGKYRVLARANGYRTVTVPVVIMAKRFTRVHLEGGASWADNEALVRSNPVRLPDGEIAGWRADLDLLSKH